MKSGLVLAGGGARGSYQVGAYQALRELGWTPGVITGTSVGCLNGALFVQDAWELARDMWLTIDDGQVMAQPAPEDANAREKAAFAAELVKNGGLDVTPLERIVAMGVDEQAVRRSPIRYGLVTVQMKNMRVQELAIEEIPEGMLGEYMLASAACFPAFQPRKIDGEAFIDGGYADNMPTALAARLGAEELLCIDVEGIGIVRPNTTGLPTRMLGSHWDLGPILKFEPATAQRNIALGYLDAYRLFGRVVGDAYAVRREDAAALTERFVAPYGVCMIRAFRANPALVLTEKVAVERFKPGPNPDLAPLELACEATGVDPTRLYTADELCDAFLAAFPAERAERYAPLFEPEPRARLVECGLAAANPSEFVAAAVRTALLGGADTGAVLKA